MTESGASEGAQAPRSRIYTRQGDRGQTSLVDGSRVAKDAARVDAYGTLDEANSWVGAALAFTLDAQLADVLRFLQHRLYNCTSNVATPPGASFEPSRVSPEDVAALEASIDAMERRSGPIRGFVLPGGTRAAGLLHVARTVCRRAERCLVTLAATEPVDEHVLRFLNRASDLLFAAARVANAVEGDGDLAWDPAAPPPGDPR